MTVLVRTAMLAAATAYVILVQTPAAALDLTEARTQAAIVAEALARGEKGDWSGAEATARKSADVLVHDLVLWRKLRAGSGSVPEYQSFVSRRGNFPGQDILAKIVLGDRGAAAPARVAGEKPLTGAAKDRWEKLAKLWAADKFDEAEKLLDSYSDSAAVLGNPARWADRRAKLARRAAREGRAALAYRLASRHYTTVDAGYAYSDLEWLAGWIALRQLKKPDVAIPHFQRFQLSVETPISLGRGGYWLGRAYEAKGDPEAARRAYAQAARHQTAYYGQLAADKIRAHGDQELVTNQLPSYTNVPAMREDDVRAMAILHFAGEQSLSHQMFLHKGETADNPLTLGALAKLALDLGKPHYAVRMAKNAARKGVVLPAAYYPVTELANYAAKIEPALAMAIARQETELNPEAISPVGARGLMQLMPGTAEKVASQIGEPYSPARLLQDWRYNARLGQAYLAEQVQSFDGSYVLAAAAYNAGPHRSRTWIKEFGDPRKPGVDVIDWIENIPFEETRNYVQRVIESLYVYRSRLSGRAGPMTISSDLNRGMSS